MLALATFLALAAPDAPLAHVAPAVLVVTAFGERDGTVFGEAAPWVTRERLTVDVVPSALARPIHCDAAGRLCVLVSGEGKVNATASLLAVGLSDNVDLRATMVVISGIAGVQPAMATVGSAAWADWIVDGGLAHHIDARDLTPGFTFEKFRLGCRTQPWCTDAWSYGTEVFHLDPSTVAHAVAVSRATALSDKPEVIAYRQHYGDTRTPSVLRCDTLADDTYWQGREMSAFASWWMTQWTAGAGHYCTTEMEDSGFAGALTQLARLHRVRWNRVLVLRTASDFDQPYPGQTPLASLGALPAGFPEALENGYLTAATVVHDVLAHPESWRG